MIDARLHAELDLSREVLPHLSQVGQRLRRTSVLHAPGPPSAQLLRNKNRENGRNHNNSRSRTKHRRNCLRTQRADNPELKELTIHIGMRSGAAGLVTTNELVKVCQLSKHSRYEVDQLRVPVCH